MKVYDFDGTIYHGDATMGFYKFALKKHPRLLRFIFLQLWGCFLYVIGIYSLDQAKETFHAYLRGLQDAPKLVEAFWDVELCNIQSWYLKQKQPDDVIITASPDFIVRPACKRLGLANVIATKVEPSTGRFQTPNNRGAKKILRFGQVFGQTAIEEFYSDSSADAPMAALAKHSYYVSKGKPVPWSEYRPSTIKRMKRFFFRREFIMYILVGFLNAFNGVLFAWIFSLLIQPNLAYALGYMLAVVVSFLINSLLTFKKELSFGRFGRFILSYAPSFVIQNASVFLLHNTWGLAHLTAYIVAALIGIPLTFFLMKVFAFKE